MTSVIYHGNNIGDWFWSTIKICQGCLLFPSLFNIFLERTLADALEDHEGTVSTGGRTITNFPFAGDTDGLAGQQQDMVKLINHLEEVSTAYGMQISAEKGQLMINNTSGISTDVTIDNKNLETVRSFKYLWAIVSDKGSKTEVLCRIAQSTAEVTKLKVIWNDKNVAISFKMRLMCSLVMCIFLHACEMWTITADIERIQALEMTYFYKHMGILYSDHITNEEVTTRIGNAMGLCEDLLTSVKRRKLKRYGHVRRSSGLAKTILQGTVQEWRWNARQEETMGRQHHRMDWPWMEQRTAESREPRGVEEVGCKIYSGAPTVRQTMG